MGANLLRGHYSCWVRDLLFNLEADEHNNIEEHYEFCDLEDYLLAAYNLRKAPTRETLELVLEGIGAKAVIAKNIKQNEARRV